MLRFQDVPDSHHNFLSHQGEYLPVCEEKAVHFSFNILLSTLPLKCLKSHTQVRSLTLFSLLKVTLR